MSQKMANIVSGDSYTMENKLSVFENFISWITN